MNLKASLGADPEVLCHSHVLCTLTVQGCRGYLKCDRPQHTNEAYGEATQRGESQGNLPGIASPRPALESAGQHGMHIRLGPMHLRMLQRDCGLGMRMHLRQMLLLLLWLAKLTGEPASGLGHQVCISHAVAARAES